MHCFAALAKPVHVEDRDQVVEFIESGVFERLPHRALGRLAVSAQHPYARGRVLQLSGERDADGDREALPQRPGCEVHPREDWGRMPLKARADTAEGQQLSVRDRAARLVDGIEQRRGVALREDETIVARVVGRRKSYRRYFEIRTAISSAADIDDVGWPDFGTALARMESMRSCCASSPQSTTSAVTKPSGRASRASTAACLHGVAARGSSELETRITSFAGFREHRHPGSD